MLCLISALSFHELKTQVHHALDMALERGKSKPRLDGAELVPGDQTAGERRRSGG